MKIAGGILGMMLGLIVFMQSCSVATLGSLGADATMGDAGSVGLLIGALFFVGGAFAFGLPTVATFLFAAAGLLGFLISGTFEDMAVWGIAALGLAAMSFFAWRSKRRRTQAHEEI